MSLATEQGLEGARAQWRSAVADVLTRSTRRDRAGLPAEPERLLDSATYEGFPIRALYTALDALPEGPLPGQWPFVRGGDPDRDVLSGWKVAEEFGSVGTPYNVCGSGVSGSGVKASEVKASEVRASEVRASEVNAEVLAALVGGVSAVVLRVGPDALAAVDLPRVLEGVYLELAPLLLDAGADFRAAAEVLLELIAGAEAAQAVPAIDFGADPLTAPLAKRAAPSVDDVLAVAVAAAATGSGRLGVRTVTVDGRAFHNLGASAGWELAGVISAGAEYLRLLIGSGLTVADALRQISFRLAADDDQFMTIAKFRAARLLWGRVAEVVGRPDDGGVRLHAETSLPMMTQRDPWVNMLRTTVAAFGAGVGGAETVRVLPFDTAIPGGYPGVQAGFARRIARNTQLLLLEESHIGRVRDAAGGSWYVEELTEALAGQAWSHFQQIEARGGFRRVHDFVTEQIDTVRKRRAADVAHRRTSITGVNEFPNLAEPVLLQTESLRTADRYASAFEALRNRSDAYLERNGTRPRMLLLPLGPLAENNVRTTFTANLLASGGIEAVNPGTVDATDVGDALAGVAAAVVCGTDARYLNELAEVVTAARSAGCEQVYLAGPEAAVAAALADAPAEARPDGYLSAKVDAVEALSALLTRLGA